MKKISILFLTIITIFIFTSCKTSDTKNGDEGDKAETPSYGEIKDNVYQNDYFGFSLAVPADWFVQTQEQMDALTETQSSENQKNMNLLGVFKYELGSPVDFNPSIIITAENVELFPGIKTGKEYLENVKKTLKQTGLNYKFGEISSKKFGKKEVYFQTLTSEIYGTKVSQTVYALKIKDYAIGITLSYGTDEQKKELEDILSGLTFE